MNQPNNFPIFIPGEADLLEAIQLVIQKYRSKSVPSPSFAQNVPLKPAAAAVSQSDQRQQLLAVESGEGDLLQSIQRIQQQTATPIFSGEADLVTFIEQIKHQNPDLSPSQLSAIISGEANSILQILNQKSQQNQNNGIPIQSGSADLLEAISFVVQKYRNQTQAYPLPIKSTPTYPQTVPLQQQPQANVSVEMGQLFSLALCLPLCLRIFQVIQTPQPNQSANGSRTSLRGQVSAISSGQTNTYYQQSNVPQANSIASSNGVGDSGKASYSLEQNKQSQFSNQQSQTTQSQVTKNVYQGQDNIYTKTAISQQTRSQSTTTNSEKYHYKITQTVPYQQPLPVQTAQPVPTSTVANTYIPPYPTQTPYNYAPPPASKQVFTYPLVTPILHPISFFTHFIFISAINTKYFLYVLQCTPLIKSHILL